MTLLEHLEARGESVREFADKIGVDRSTLRKIAYRKRQPSLALAIRIAAHTGGAVAPGDLVLRAEERPAW
jgi:transcriptional regulator with XRE-family HTH domain